ISCWRGTSLIDTCTVLVGCCCVSGGALTFRAETVRREVGVGLLIASSALVRGVMPSRSIGRDEMRALILRKHACLSIRRRLKLLKLALFIPTAIRQERTCRPVVGSIPCA